MDMLVRLKESHVDFELWSRRAKQVLIAQNDHRLG
jgi:hypothetical protein